MPNDPLIEVMARAIAKHEYDDYSDNDIKICMPVAQAAIAALKAEGWMLVKWERVYSDPDDLHVVVDFDKEGDGYQLVGLEPPAAALAGRE